MRSTISAIIAVTFISVFAPSAFADHSLANVMDEQSVLKAQVELSIKKRGLVCDLESSIQMKPTGRAKNIPNAWRQVAFCYESEEQLKAATEQLAKGNQLEEFGLSSTYGLPVAAILDVTYVLMSPDYKAVNQKALRLSIR